jgi:hypothetical protein
MPLYGFGSMTSDIANAVVDPIMDAFESRVPGLVDTAWPSVKEKLPGAVSVMMPKVKEQLPGLIDVAYPLVEKKAPELVRAAMPEVRRQIPQLVPLIQSQLDSLIDSYTKKYLGGYISDRRVLYVVGAGAGIAALAMVFASGIIIYDWAVGKL